MSTFLATSTYARTQEELVRNEIIIGLGITLVGGAIGFAYAFFKNQRQRAAGLPTLESDVLAAFEGALIGIIIAIVSILLYRIIFHAQSAKYLAQIQREAQLSALQEAQAQRYQKLTTSLGGISVEGLRTASALGIANIPQSSLTAIQPLQAQPPPLPK